MNPAIPKSRFTSTARWCKGAGGKSEPVLNPATGEAIGTRAACRAAPISTARWRPPRRASRPGARSRPIDRYKLMRKAADILRSRADDIGRNHDAGAGQAVRRGEEARPWPAPTSSTGSPRRAAAPMAASSRRAPTASISSSSRSRSGRSPPSRRGISRSTRRCARSRPRIAAGCSVIIKGPEETPASCAALVQAYADAGLPAGVLNLVFGVPAEISEYLIPHPGDPQDLLHRLDGGGQASGHARGQAHEARDHGAGRPRAGHRVRGRRSRCAR